MRLHELVALRNELLKAVDLSVIQRELESNSNKILTISQLGGEKYTERLSSIAHQHLESIKDANNDKVKEMKPNDVNIVNGKSLNEKIPFFAQFILLIKLLTIQVN